MHSAFAGFLTGLSLIVAIGAQNAYVLRLGLVRHHVGLAVWICAISDVILIFAGVAGIGGIIHSFPSVLDVLKWVGVAYLVAYALRSFWRARRPGVLLPSDAARPSARAVAVTTLAFTFLNPHVYLDTVLLLGSIGNQYGSSRWLFASGASVASIVWFSGLGYGGKAASRLMSRPLTWRVLDVVIGLIMIFVAVNVAMTDVAP